MPKFFKSLFGQVVIALVVGIAVGVLYPQFGASLKPLGDGFIKLIKVLITPIVFCVVVLGIAGAGDLKKVGRVGLKAVVYFEVVTTIALLLGFALALLGSAGKPFLAIIEQASHVFFKMMFFVVKLAPLGVLGAIAFTVGKYGVASLQQLGYLVALFYLTVIIFVVVVLGAILRLAGFNIFKLIRYLREELMIVAGTASSDSVLPQIMR